MAKQKAMFLLKLSYPVAMIILLIGGFSLVISFYMGMITGQSIRQLPEPSVASQETNRLEAPELKNPRIAIVHAIVVMSSSCRRHVVATSPSQSSWNLITR